MREDEDDGKLTAKERRELARAKKKEESERKRRERDEDKKLVIVSCYSHYTIQL